MVMIEPEQRKQTILGKLDWEFGFGVKTATEASALEARIAKLPLFEICKLFDEAQIRSDRLERCKKDFGQFVGQHVEIVTNPESADGSTETQFPRVLAKGVLVGFDLEGATVTVEAGKQESTHIVCTTAWEDEGLTITHLANINPIA